MKNNQKGFASIILVGVIVVFIALGGYFAWSKKSNEIIQNANPVTTFPEVKNPESKTQTPTIKDETSDWKTYTDNIYGFEIKYPNDFMLIEYPNKAHPSFTDRSPGVTISSPQCETLFQSDSEGGIWPKDCVAYNLLIQDNKILVEGTDVVKTTTQVAGYTATAEKIESYEGLWEELNRSYIHFKKDNKWYISSLAFNKVNGVAAENFLNQILSTFKFIK